MIDRFLAMLLLTTGYLAGVAAQSVPIIDYAVTPTGQVAITVASTPDHYFVLQAKHVTDDEEWRATAVQRGAAGQTTLSDGLRAYPRESYRVLRHAVAEPADTDGDGVDDLTELGDLPTQSPLNAAPPIDRRDGTTALSNFADFQSLAVTRDRVQWSEFLNGLGYVKYIIVDFWSSAPKLYFVDTEHHDLHADFAAEVGIAGLGEQVKKGQVIFHPASIAESGALGTFAFTFSNGYGDTFESVRRTYEILAANMPFLTGNLAYYVTGQSTDEYERDEGRYLDSRVATLFEADVFSEIEYWGLNQRAAYGIFRQLEQGELPSPRDIVLYDALPNDLPRVSGIMSSIVQTPLSHVNLRAIQNGVPNAYVRDPLAIDSVAALLDKPVYYRVSQEGYELREATLEEVNDWFDGSRPTEMQEPPLDLSYTEIEPLGNIEFSMFDGYGAKCTNLATMHGFGFPQGTIPDGFGVPFYYYQEFMKASGFFERVKKMLATEGFYADRETRARALSELRAAIKDAPLPDWMHAALGEMQQSFPPGTSIRCRSSTNNEDLPGFNGAGLYDSKTQHPWEGHIEKSIKQVYASLWNLRAFEERDFFRVNHFTASMGVLCHPNFAAERANGVGVSTDPLYNTEATFYLNTQLGEELITNPSSAARAEEILLDRTATERVNYILVQRSSLSEPRTQLMERAYLEEMRDYLTVIHDEFAELYDASDDSEFAMDIEYKITSSGQLSIKQARPWVVYVAGRAGDGAAPPLPIGETLAYPNPTDGLIRVLDSPGDLTGLGVVDALGRRVLTFPAGNIGRGVDLSALPTGTYFLVGWGAEGAVRMVTKVQRR